MTQKTDWFKVCNDQGVPEEDFKLTFCSRCYQEDCARSRRGTTAFEQRVTTWQDRLFKPPQLPKTDPRWQAIAAKKFIALPIAGQAYTVREWIDPQTVDTPAVVIQAPAAPRVVAPPAPVVAKAPEQPPPKVEAIPEVAESSSTTPEVNSPKQNLLVNTPYAGPRTLGNQPVTPPKQQDNWSAPIPRKSDDRVVQPGSKVKMGRRP